MNCELGYVINFNSKDIKYDIHPVVNNLYKPMEPL